MGQFNNGTMKKITSPDRFALFLIRLYQASRGSFLPGSACRFTPSCSEYTYEAVQKHGIIKGLILGLKRVSRCHPLNPGGIDPVE